MNDRDVIERNRIIAEKSAEIERLAAKLAAAERERDYHRAQELRLANEWDAQHKRLAEAEADNARFVAANKARDEFLRGHRYKHSEVDGYIDLCESQMADLKARLAEVESRLNLADAEVTMLRHFNAEAERDAARYRWLRERINFRDQFVRSEDGRGISSKWRAWVHDDYRENPPASEHIDEYIDTELGSQP